MKMSYLEVFLSAQCPVVVLSVNFYLLPKKKKKKKKKKGVHFVPRPGSAILILYLLRPRPLGGGGAGFSLYKKAS